MSRTVARVPDTVLALGLLAVSVALVGPVTAAGWWQPENPGGDVVVLLLCAAVVAVGRSRPRATLVAVACVAVMPWWSADTGGLVAIAVALAAAVTTREGVRLIVAVPLAGTAALIGQFPRWPEQVPHPEQWYWIARDTDRSGVLLLVGIAVVAALLGAAAHTKRRDAEALQRLRDAERQRALDEERAAIAREIHDTVAHHVAAIVLRAQAAERVADRRPEEAASAVQWIAGAGQRALSDMRAVVRVLRAGESRENLLGGLALPDALDGLVERVRESGATVSAVIRPVPGLTTVQQSAVLRICQEALTNAVMHASSEPIDVVLRREGDQVLLEVTSVGAPAAPPAAGGNGLRIMDERARAAGGAVSAGPIGGAWRVRLVMPLEQPRSTVALAEAVR